MRPLRHLYRILRRLANLLGFRIIIVRNSRRPKNGAYETVLPIATYAPWVTDRPFRETYEAIRAATYVDEYRCYALWQLVRESTKVLGALIEVGVWRGGSDTLIARRARACGITDRVYLCDTFAGVVKAGPYDEKYRGGEHADTSRSTVEGIIQELNLENAHILSGVFPDDTGHLIQDHRFRFCHIDVDTYQSAKDAFDWLWPKLSVDGVIVFDDYGFHGCVGVTRCVNEIQERRDLFFLHNLNGQAVIVKRTTCTA